jgi:hypothetical protein
LRNIVLEYAIRGVPLKQVRLKLKCKHRLLVYADDVHILGGTVYVTQKNTESLVVAIKETGLEVNADKTKYIVISRDQNAGRSHSTNSDSNFCERVEPFRYLGTIVTYHDSVQEEIKNRLKSRNACCHSMQNLLSSSLLFKIKD